MSKIITDELAREMAYWRENPTVALLSAGALMPIWDADGRANPGEWRLDDEAHWDGTPAERAIAALAYVNGVCPKCLERERGHNRLCGKCAGPSMSAGERHRYMLTARRTAEKAAAASL